MSDHDTINPLTATASGAGLYNYSTFQYKRLYLSLRNRLFSLKLVLVVKAKKSETRMTGRLLTSATVLHSKTSSKHITGSEECLFYMTIHNMHILGVRPFFV